MRESADSAEGRNRPAGRIVAGLAQRGGEARAM